MLALFLSSVVSVLCLGQSFCAHLPGGHLQRSKVISAHPVLPAKKCLCAVRADKPRQQTLICCSTEERKGGTMSAWGANDWRDACMQVCVK